MRVPDDRQPYARGFGHDRICQRATAAADVTESGDPYHTGRGYPLRERRRHRVAFGVALR
jgi:hypothetical protein